MLFDAVPDASLIPEGNGDAAAVSDQGAAQQFDTSLFPEDVKVVGDQSMAVGTNEAPPAQTRRELVIIDTSVDDYQTLVNDILNATDPNRELSVVTIDGSDNGIEQISSILSGYSDLDALHIVSHGDDSGIMLGGTLVGQHNLGGYAAEIAQWGDALSPEGDLLLLGCDLASTADGREFLQSISTLTGADVAASANDTGYAARGGDWDLEFLLGQLETTVAFSSDVQENWTGLLAPGPAAAISTANATPQIGSDVTFNVQFDNTAAAGSGDTGFGPYLDLLFPVNGADGAGGTDTPDGLTFNGATYLGQDVTAHQLTFNDIDGAPGDNGTPGDTADDVGGTTLGYVTHPLATAVQNELQVLTFSGAIDGGSLQLEFDGQTTAAIDLSGTGGVLTAAAVQTSLEGLSNIAAGDISVTGGSLPGEALFIEFTGALAQTNVAEITVNNALLENGGSTANPHGRFSATTVTNGSNQAQAVKVFGTTGDQLVVLELPFGSVTPEQPAIDVVVNASLSNLADNYDPGNPQSELTVTTRSGFRFGTDAVDNPATDPGLFSDIQTDARDWVQSASIQPSLITVNTDIDGPEDESATGPNYPRVFTVEVDIPEGQTIQDLDITDLLPDNVVFLSLDSVSSPDGDVVFTSNVPAGLNSLGNPTNTSGYNGTNGFPTLDVSGTRADQSLVITADEVTGEAGTDVTIQFSGYIAEFAGDATGTPTTAVIPTNGEDDLPASRSTHTASATGNWTPLDVRDQGGSMIDNAVAAAHSTVVDAKSIALQKGVRNTGSGSTAFASPGDILEYTLSFQISDYFTFGDLVLTDTFSDGQRFYNAAGFEPTFSLSDFDNTYSGQLFNVHVGTENSATTEVAGDNFIVDQSSIDNTDNSLELGNGSYVGGAVDPTDGTTTITIELSERLQQLGEDGILQGGLSTTNDDTTNLGSATGTITFYTVVQQDFSDTFPSGDRSVDHDDVLTNNADITGSVRENQEDGSIANIIGSETDDSSAQIGVEVGVLSKSIYAINGDTTLTDGISLQPGDDITYRLTYTLPNTDFESLSLTDFLPLPAIVVDDFNADDVTGDVWTFDPDATFDGVAGTVELGPSDTFYSSSPGNSDYFDSGNIIVDAAANSIRFDYGTYDDPTSPSTVIDLLFTATVQDDPFADGLYLTNIARVEYGATNQVTQPADALVQIELNQPELNIRKGIVATDDGSVTVSPVGPTVNNEFQTVTYTGSDTSATFRLSFGGQTTGDISVTASAATIATELAGLSSIGTGNVLVTGDRPTAGPVTIEFTGALAGSDVAELITSTTDAGGVIPVAVSTEFAGGQAITINDVGDPTPFSGRITSSALDTQLIDADITADGLESGDTVRFMIVVENTGDGRNGAFDVQIRDELPPEFEYVTGSLSVVDGTGSALSFTTVGTHPEHALFGSGILLDDPGATSAGPSGENAGAIDAYSAYDGRNLAVITYEAKLVDTVATSVDDVTTGETITNNAVLVSYAGAEGAEDHTASQNEVQTITPTDNPIGGTYTLTFDGQTTAPLAFDADIATVKAALEALSNIGAGNIQVSGPLSAGAVSLTFVGELADTNVAPVTIDESGLSLAAVTSTTDGATNEIQQITTSGNVVGGFFTLTLGAETTAPLGFNATAATVQAALEALPSVNPGDVNVTGGALPDSAINVEFTGALAAQDVGEITFDDSSLSGGGGLATTTTTPGAANETQTLESLSTVTGGTFTLTFNSQTTAPLNHNATAAEIQSALEGLAGVSAGDVNVTGGALPGSPVSVEFTGALAGTDVGAITIDDSGLTASVNTSVATTTQGSLNEIQRLTPTGGVTGGTFTLEFGGEVTAAITHNADAATITAALEALESIPAGSVSVSGGSGSDVEIEFTGALTQQNTALLIVDSASLIGGTMAAVTVQEGSSQDPRDPASLLIRDGSLAKSIVSTSEAHTTAINSTERVTIGEIVRYRVQVELPEGTHSNVRIFDNLPGGLTYIDDGTAVMSFITDTPGAITSTVGAGVLPDNAVSTSDTTNVDNYSSGRDVWLKLGDFTNTDDDANLEYVVVEFNALVTNNGSSNAGNSKFNDAQLYVDGTEVFDIANADRPQVIIAEPNISTPAKEVRLDGGTYGETATADAGDTVEFRVQFSNGSGDNDSDAFNVRLVDAVPDDLSLDTASIEVYIDSVLQTAGVTYTDSSSAATDTIDLTIDTVAKGQSVEVRYSVTLDAAVSPSETLTNTATVTYTSLPGASGTADGTGGNSTGSDLASLNGLDTNAAATDDAAGTTYNTLTGSLYGERDGSDTTGAPNDYYVTDTAAINVDGTKSIVKTLDGTSIDDSGTNGNNVANEAVIGEIATYTVTVNFNEGTMPNASIIDTLDAGLAFVGVTGSTVTGVNLNGTVNLNTPTVSADGRTITWDLETITDAANGDVTGAGDTDGSISITYQAIVTNVIGNQNTDTLNNTVEFRYDDDPATIPNPRESLTTSAANLTIIEPEVSVTKTAALDTDGDTFYDDGTVGDAGDAVQYTITLSNTSGVDAFDIDFSDALPTVSGGTSAILSPAFSVTDNATAGAVSAADFELVGSDAAGWTLQKRSAVNIDLLASQVDGIGAPRVITLTVTGTIANSVTPNQSIDNTATVDWSSLDGTLANPSPHTTDDTERTGADGAGAANLNNYENSATGTVTVNAPVFSKHLFATDQTETSGTDVTIGEVVTYALVVSLPEGVVPDTTVVDLLPAGLDYLSHSVITSAAASADYLGTSLLAADFNGTIGGTDPSVTGGSSAGDDVTFTFGQINVAVDNDGTNNAFLILVNAQVADVSSTTGYSGNQDTIGNTATIDFSTDSAPPQSSNTVNVTVVEPSLAITKEFGPTVDVDLADAGDTVSIVLTVDNTQGTSTAYEVAVEDTLNPLHYDLTTVSTGTAGVDYPADFAVNFNSVSGLLEYTGGDIAAGATVTFTITVDLLESVTPNSTLLNTATITDGSTLEGSVSGERNTPDADGDGSNTDSDTVRIRRNSLAGFVWDDANNDGVFQAGESGLQNVDVRLTGIDHLSNPVDVTVQTLADGSYLFDNLRPGNYTITEDPGASSLPAGYLDGIDTVGSAGGVDTVNDVFSGISLPAGSETFGTAYNFAEIQDASLSGSVYHDASNDGTFQGIESGISGVAVRLTGRDDLNQLVDITVNTSGSGAFTFTGLRPSDASGYTITQLANPSGFLDGLDTDGSLANGDASTDDVISSINVVPGDDGISYNFGEVLPSTLSGYVYHDSDNDGDRSDEPVSSGIQNSRITLTGTDDQGNTVSQFVDTDASGYYEFSNLRPSNASGYTLTQTTLPAGFVDGLDTIGTPGGSSANNVFSGIVVTSGTNGTENNFGELIPASLSGTVFNDHDNDGLFEPGDGETGIGSVSVRITGIDDLGNSVDVTVNTAADGTYSFTNLRPSNPAGYTITESQPATFNDGTDSDGSLSNGVAVNGTAPNDDTITSINVVSGNAGTGYNFGETGSSITGTVFVDDDRDGDLDGGEGVRISGVTVELFDMTDPLNPVSLGTTTTAADGTYSFDDLPAGDYRVVQTHPTAYGTTSSNTIDLTLPLTGSTGNDFGEALFDLGDTVYFDANNDGVQNPGEEGLAGVDVTLQFAGQNGVFGDGDDPPPITVTTDANGDYSFTELFNGNYTVTVDTSDLPSGMTGTEETDDSAAAIDAVSRITVSNADRFDVDFGYTGQGTLGDFVWVDVDGDGIQDSGEPGLADITVDLTFAGADGVFGSVDDLTLSTTTNATGGYLFANLPAGDFRVDVDTADGDLPASLTAVSGAQSIVGTAAVTLGVAATNNAIDFGFTGTLSVGDRLWLDQDGDGVQDSGEAGLPGVDVTIVWLGQDGVLGTADDFTVTTTTDGNGNYQFDRLPDGDFRVTYDAADLPAGVTPSFEVDATTDNQVDLTLAGTGRSDVDFGFQGAGSIGDFVFLDADADGLQDVGEPGLANITVNLTFAGADGVFGNADDITLSTTTDAAGAYSFAGLPDGDYRVDVDAADTDLPDGVVRVTGTQSNGSVASVTLNSTQRSFDNVDFGFRGTGSLGDRIWHDVDGDGVQDAGEPGLEGVTVNLLAAGQDGVFGTADDFTLSTLTGSDGSYTFAQLPAGDYRVDAVEADIPGGQSLTFEQDDGANAIASTAEVQLAAGQVRDDIDFGYTGTRTLGDRIWFDANADGLQTAGEPGLPGIEVTLTYAGPDGNFATTDDNVTLTTTTDTNGNYQFDRLLDGDYTVTVTTTDLPAGAVQTADTDDAVLGAGTLDHTSRVRLNGASRNDADFGYRGNSSIGDLIFLDTDNSGTLTPGDRGLPGIDVTAAVDVNGDTIPDYTVTVTTDINGAYLFDNLIPGTYTVTVDDADLPAAASPAVDPDGTGTPHTASVVLPAGTDNDVTDFGYVANGRIGDRVWLDINSDGTQNTDEPGLANVSVALTWLGADGVLDIAPGGDDEVFTTTTDANGNYLFEFLPEGNYRVDVDQATAPGNTSLTTANDPTNRTLPVGGSIDDADFGFVGGGTIGDFVFYDFAGDGVFNSDDVAYAGIDVTLTADIDGDGLDETFTTTTDAAGFYQFSGLPLADYTVSITPPVGTAPSFDADGTGTPHSSQVTLSAGTPSSDTQDFGLTGTGTVGDTVFFDEDGDGLQGPGESGIPGVTVTIGVDLDADNISDFTTTTVTDANGQYTFGNLPAGQVTVTVSAPAGTSPTTNHDGTPGGDNTNVVNLPAGGTDNTSDFGYRGTGVIGDTVYFDANADGIQNDGTVSPAEPGLPGVTVELDIDFDGNGTVDHTLTTTTATDGRYQFSNLPAGDYTVRVTPPVGTTPTADNDGIAGASANQSSLSLPPNTTNLAQDFGYTGTGGITDTVFFDIDNDATEEVGTDDRGIAGVDVTLEIDVNGDGSTDYTQTVATDANGDFTFTNLIPGVYTITTDPADMRPGLANNPTVDNDGIVTPHDADYTVTAGNTTQGPGFGFHATPDYAITKTGDGSFTSAQPGDTINYTILVENVGELDGRNIVVTDQFPVDVLRITAAPGGTINPTAGTIVWNLPALNPAQQQILTVTAEILDPVPAGIDDFTNSVSVDDDRFNGDDPDTSNNTSSYTATLVAQPDYRIEKTDGPAVSTLSPGDSTTYTITVTNEGDQDGTGVIVTDRFPTDALTVTNAFGGTVDATAGTITWNLGNLNAGDTVILQPVFTVNTPADAARDDVTNTADVTDDGTNGPDPTPANNSSSDTNTLDAVPDYRITKSLDSAPASILPGESVTYSLLVENVGDQDGTGVVVTDVFPTDVLENVSAPGGVVDAINGIITWNIGSLNGGGDSVLLTVTADVRSVLAAGLHNAVNTASVTDDLSNGTDPTPANNTDNDVTPVGAFPDLVIEKTDDDATDVRPGETVVYTISYANVGTQDATGVVITETVPDGAAFNADDSSVGWVDQGNGQFTFLVGNLDSLDSGVVEFAVDADVLLDPNREELINTVTIADDGTNGPDANPADNTAMDDTPLQIFSFDSFEDHSGQQKDLDTFNEAGVEDPGDDPYRYRLRPLPIETVYTGIVDPGTTLSGKIYDQHGRLIGEQTVVADTAGNWLMQFPTVVLYETPHEMRIDQTLAVQNSTYDAGFNLRRFFHPAVHTQLYMNEPISIGAAFYHSPNNVLQAMHDANNNPLSFNWMHHNYELVVSSTNTSAM